MIPLPPPFAVVVRVICALILLCWLLNIFGILGPAWPAWHLHAR